MGVEGVETRKPTAATFPHPNAADDAAPAAAATAGDRRPATGSIVLDAVPIFVVVLLAGHVLALVYWMYRLVSEKQPPRRKTQ